MKANALYHLMQLRAKNLQESLTPERQSILSELQRSLHVKRKGGAYILSWKMAGKELEHIVENEKFRFYGKGDSAKDATIDKKINSRASNWQSALEVWRDIFKRSNLDDSVLSDNGSMSFGNSDPDIVENILLVDLMLSAVLAFCVYIFYSISESIQMFFVSYSLMQFSSCYSAVHLRQKLSLLEKIVVSTSGALPVYFGVNAIGMIFVLWAIFFACDAEKRAERKSVYFALSGVMFGVGAGSLGGFSTFTIISLIVLMSVIAIIDSRRFKFDYLLAMIAGFGISMFVLSVLMNSYNIALLTNDLEAVNEDFIFNIIFAITATLFFCSVVWWIIGVQYYLIPWFSLFSLFTACAAILYMGNLEVYPLIMIFLGFVIFVLLRTIRGFLSTKLIR